MIRQLILPDRVRFSVNIEPQERLGCRRQWRRSVHLSGETAEIRFPIPAEPSDSVSGTADWKAPANKPYGNRVIRLPW